jgi:hypothetical protein
MSNYTKATNFATKDTLPTGDANKIVKGTEIDNEFNAISGAVSSKADIASPTFTGTPAAPTATVGTNTTQVATTAFVLANIPSVSVIIPVGTVMLFYQAAAPTGWTQVTTQNDKALRVVSGTGGGTGGSVAFTTAFVSQAVSGSVGTSGATTLSTSQIPSHAHSYSMATGTTATNGDNESNQFPFFGGNTGATTGTEGGGGSHTHTGGTFTGTAINLAVQYIDIIICSKN